MKHFFVIVAIAMMIQGSHGKLQDNFDDLQKGVQGLIDVLIEIIPATETMVKATQEQLPQTDDYAKYRKDFEEYLTDVDDYKTTRGLCMDKTLRIVNHFNKLRRQYEEEDAPAESAIVIKLFNENGNEDISRQLVKVGAFHGKGDVLAQLNDPHTTDAIRMLPMALHLC